MSFQAFIDAAKSIISLGAKTNATARQEIREVVGKLGDELDRALSLTDSYLVGAKFSIDDDELSRYLADVDGKLMGSYYEHHICAGLYHLADKFDQIFDPTRFSVSLSSYTEIPRLINELKSGEQVVLDDLNDMATKLRDYSSQLLSGSMTREQVLKAVEYHREEIARYRKQIKQKRRTLLSKL
ncbi:hypothetical protein [Billgrantia kenyensis]|uniref:Uncharacterized protein n=1 Tax=Billgrantia kenyensis TaxID=321266 RepID=A0A7V9W542_9GAMM|nr:hypothetical protein [Halomonas kenyensis]MBA2781233.1 hypothetical protein [Halomonas kenyensis]MCG6663895.1 hypothetical protein [Halomonas kenyensis]